LIADPDERDGARAIHEVEERVVPELDGSERPVVCGIVVEAFRVVEEAAFEVVQEQVSARSFES
jgi:hypothetical protein